VLGNDISITVYFSSFFPRPGAAGRDFQKAITVYLNTPQSGVAPSYSSHSKSMETLEK